MARAQEQEPARAPAARAEAPARNEKLTKFINDEHAGKPEVVSSGAPSADVSERIGQQFRAGGFPAIVAETLANAGLPPNQLCLEITESSLMRTDSQMSEDLVRLRRLGVHLAIDDVGTGYSSLSYLHQLPVDEIKINRSFTSRMGIDPHLRHLIEAILAMAKAVELTIVAEGVETAEQLDYLSRQGCDVAQGYLFAPPRPAPQATFSLS